MKNSGVAEWLVQTVMLMCIGMSIICAGDRRFEVKVGMPQGSIPSPLLFSIAMDVVTKEARNGLPWEFLYADDLVFMASASGG